MEKRALAVVGAFPVTPTRGYRDWTLKIVGIALLTVMLVFAVADFRVDLGVIAVDALF